MALSRKTVKRLTTLIEFMEKLPKSANKHFDMSAWFRHIGTHSHGIMNNKPIPANALKHCGTTACALGWAATIPAFRRAGLKVYAIETGAGNAERSKRFFGINEYQQRALFDYGLEFDGTPGDREVIHTPKQWAKRARRLLSEWRSVS